MTGILVYVEAACIIIGRFLILYAVFCVAKTFLETIPPCCE